VRGSDDDGAWMCVDMGYLYLKVWWWAMGLIYHNTIPMIPAAGPFTPSFVESNVYEAKFSTAEDVLLIVLKLLGLGFWSLVISKLIHAITVLGNPAVIAYQQDIDAVNRFCAFNRLPSHLTRELRRYMFNTKEVSEQHARSNLPAYLPSLISPCLPSHLHSPTPSHLRPQVYEQRSRANIYSKLSPLLIAKVTKLLNRPLFRSVLVKKALEGIPDAEGELPWLSCPHSPHHPCTLLTVSTLSTPCVHSSHTAHTVPSFSTPSVPSSHCRRVHRVCRRRALRRCHRHQRHRRRLLARRAPTSVRSSADRTRRLRESGASGAAPLPLRRRANGRAPPLAVHRSPFATLCARARARVRGSLSLSLWAVGGSI
jgi:hypothetical protein